MVTGCTHAVTDMTDQKPDGRMEGQTDRETDRHAATDAQHSPGNMARTHVLCEHTPYFAARDSV